MDDSQASGQCPWGMEVLVTETRTLERGGGGEGEVQGPVLVPYLTDKETKAPDVAFSAKFRQRSQFWVYNDSSDFPWGYLPWRGRGAGHLVPGPGNLSVLHHKDLLYPKCHCCPEEKHGVILNRWMGL